MVFRKLFLCIFYMVVCAFIFMPVFSQEEEEGESKITAGAGFYSSYIWRGTRYGSGPVIQPELKFISGRFTGGGWGCFDFNDYQETDLFFSISLPAGFSLGMTDYYYPGLDYCDYSDTTGSHAFEINAGFTHGGLSLSANYILNQAGGAGTKGDDKYFEIKYSFKSFFVVAGAGDGWHSTNNASGSDKFRICNLGVGATRTIKITETFSLPVNGQIIFNPDLKKMYIVAGFTLQAD